MLNTAVLQSRFNVAAHDQGADREQRVPEAADANDLDDIWHVRIGRQALTLPRSLPGGAFKWPSGRTIWWRALL